MQIHENEIHRTVGIEEIQGLPPIFGVIYQATGLLKVISGDFPVGLIVLHKENTDTVEQAQ